MSTPRGRHNHRAEERDTLHARIADKLGWKPAAVRGFSLVSLRERIRPVSPKLAADITHAMSIIT